MNILSFYLERSDILNRELKAYNKKYNLIASLRLLVFAITLFIIIYLIIDGKALIAFAAFIPGAILFLILVKRHSLLNDRKVQTANLLQVNFDEIKRLQEGFTGFESGAAFIDATHPYTSDLDIFGTGSLYQYINRAESYPGRNMLAKWLKHSAHEEEILMRQEAVKELQLQPEFRQCLQAYGLGVEDKIDDIEEISIWLKEPYYFTKSKFLRSIRYLMPVFTIAAIVLSLFCLPNIVSYSFASLQIVLLGFYAKKINKMDEGVSKIYNVFLKYSRQLELIEKQNFHSDLLVNARSKLTKGSITASKSFKRLHTILDSLDSRRNLLNVLLNALYLRDLHTAFQLESWKQCHSADILNWFDVLGVVETISSLAAFSFNNDEFEFPVIRQGAFELEATDVGHPLLKQDVRVGNNLKISGESQFIIITGSNMAGKSTFLRAIGVNIVLALAGAPVCAKSYILSPVQIYTGMRMGDSLMNSESTFYYELKRLKEIIYRLNGGEKLFILLDEILRGTNSVDKLKGSQALIKQLIIGGASGIIATHDLALSEMQEEYPINVRNFNFEVNIQGEKFVFDYKLKQGPCTVNNATELMRKIGIWI